MTIDAALVGATLNRCCTTQRSRGETEDPESVGCSDRVAECEWVEGCGSSSLLSVCCKLAA